MVSFFFSSRRRHTRFDCDWSSDVCSSDLFRGKHRFELLDTGVFRESRYFDLFVEYAKADVEDILIRITAVNRGPEAAALHILPQLWFRNTWSWGQDLRRPVLRKATSLPGSACPELHHWQYGKRWLLCAGQPELLFTENETNNA